MNKHFCLKCGKEIEDGKLWHDKCIKDFFGSKEIPTISIDTAKLKTVAITQLSEQKAVAGVQEKLSLHLDTSIKKRPRLTIIGYPLGYILKPQTSKYKRLPEFEHTAMLLAELCGIETVPHGIVKLENGEFAYITKRIDRCGNNKIHMEDFCQASGLTTKSKYKSNYTECIQLINKHSKNPQIDKVKLFRCLVFDFVIGNSDVHLKNFSFVMDDNGKLSLSPFYDLMPTKVILPTDREELGMLLNGKKTSLTKKDFDAFAIENEIPELTKTKIINEIISKQEEFFEIIENSLLDQNSKSKWKKLITSNIKRLK